MEDDRIWAFEEGLWTADADGYRESIDDNCLMVVPTHPFAMSGTQAIEAVTDTPRWTQVELSDRKVARPEDGLIVVAYHARASKDGGEAYDAWCTSTYRRLAHDEWRVVQHQQTVVPTSSG